jgi:hypothetical protein
MTSDKPADRPAPGDVLDTPPPSAQPEASRSGWLVSKAEVLSRIASYEWSGYECLEGDELPDDPRVVTAERIAACVRDILQHVTAIQPLTQVDVDGLCAYLSAHGADEHLCKVARAYFDQARTVTPAAPDADWEERLWLYEVKLQYGPR